MEFFSSWSCQRSYTEAELQAAEFLKFEIQKAFEPAGVHCGTVYDERTACQFCGTGQTQLSPLRLDLRRVTRSKDLARTFANEWIVSQRLADLIADRQITGCQLALVEHRADPELPAVDLGSHPAGREILEMAAAAGAPHPTWEFFVWLNRPEQDELLEAFRRMMQVPLVKRRRGPKWYHIQPIADARVQIAEGANRFGINPFDEDIDGECRCPQGHTKGFNILSELTIVRLDKTWDFAVTDAGVGWKLGDFLPRTLIVISPRFRELLKSAGIKGYELEVVHTLARR